MRSEYPDVADRTVDQADIDTANAYVDRVRTTGYTAGEIAQLHALGLSDDAIARLKVDQTIYDPGDVSPGALDSAFDTLAAEMRNTAALAEDFAADAWTFAGRSNTPPVADFDEGAHSGPDGLTVKFKDTSTSEDLDPLAVTWDFGDGNSRDRNPGRHRRAHLRRRRPVHGHGDRDRRVRLGLEEQADLARAAQPTSPSHPSRRRRSRDRRRSRSTSTPRHRATRTARSRRTSGTSATPRSATGEDGDAHLHVAERRPPDGDAEGHRRPGRHGDHDPAGHRPPTRRSHPTRTDDVLDAAPTGVLDVLANDEDLDGDPITVSGNTQGAHGTVSCAPLGGCIYTATAGFEGSDEFTYTVRDATGLEATATVSVTVGAPPRRRSGRSPTTTTCPRAAGPR